MTKLKDQPDFDRVAHIYRWAEYLALGPILQRARIHFIHQLESCQSAFVLGDGDGRFLAALLISNSQLEAVAVDISAAMLSLLNRRCAFARDRIRTLHASALEVDIPRHADLVVTQFFLDSLDQHNVDTLIDRIASVATPGMLWLVSDFQVPAGLWRWPGKAYIRSLYVAFQVLTGLRVHQLPDTRSPLTRAGFRRVAYHQKLGGMIYTELWRLEGNDTIQQAGSTDAGRVMAPESQQGKIVEPDTGDALPNPEPEVPSLPGPDPGVFHHEPGAPFPAEFTTRPKSQ